MNRGRTGGSDVSQSEETVGGGPEPVGAAGRRRLYGTKWFTSGTNIGAVADAGPTRGANPEGRPRLALFPGSSWRRRGGAGAAQHSRVNRLKEKLGTRRCRAREADA